MEEWFIGDYDLTASYNVENLSGNTYQLTNTSQNADSISWGGFGGNSNEDVINVTFTGPGIYAIELTVFNNCDTLTLVDTLNLSSTGLFDFIQPEFKIFPNPSSDFISISGVELNSQYIILNSKGKLVLESTFTGNAISLQSLKEGLYFIEFQFGESKEIIRFVVSR